MKYAITLLLFTSIACDRAHMSASYGKATRAALQNQVIDPAAGDKKRAEQGLDPEEAAVIAKSYRGSLSKDKEGDKEKPQLMLVTEPKKDAAK